MQATSTDWLAIFALDRFHSG